VLITLVKDYSKESFFFILSLLVFSTTSLVTAGTWLLYDDGVEDGNFVCVSSGEYYAVKFMLPEGCDDAELLTVSFFKTDREISMDTGELTISVLGSDFSTELGSFDVNLDPPGGVFRSFTPPERIVVPREFYIVMNGNPEACLGVDSSTSGHSYEKNGEWTIISDELMVRAEIECIYEAVGGELIPGIGQLLSYSLLVLVPLIAISGYYGYKKIGFTKHLHI
jgi:hypothetical protein